jgi:hypothetical protein
MVAPAGPPLKCANRRMRVKANIHPWAILSRPLLT